jgi:hypothetical protein
MVVDPRRNVRQSDRVERDPLWLGVLVVALIALIVVALAVVSWTP